MEGQPGAQHLLEDVLPTPELHFVRMTRPFFPVPVVPHARERTKIQQPEHHTIPPDHWVSTNSTPNLTSMEPHDGFNVKLMVEVVWWQGGWYELSLQLPHMRSTAPESMYT